MSSEGEPGQGERRCEWREEQLVIVMITVTTMTAGVAKVQQQCCEQVGVHALHGLVVNGATVSRYEGAK